MHAVVFSRVTVGDRWVGTTAIPSSWCSWCAAVAGMAAATAVSCLGTHKCAAIVSSWAAELVSRGCAGTPRLPCHRPPPGTRGGNAPAPRPRLLRAGRELVLLLLLVLLLHQRAALSAVIRFGCPTFVGGLPTLQGGLRSA